MSFLDAVYSILREKRQWTSAGDLVQEALDRGLCTSTANNPIGSLSSTLRAEITRGSNRRGFVHHGTMFGLEEWGLAIPPPETTDTTRRRRRRQTTAPSLSLTEEQIQAIKETMPPDQFEELFGDLWQRYQEQRRQRLITQVSDRQLLRDIRHEVDLIQSYLLGRGNQAPSPELVANWIVLCYQLKLYREGAALFRQLGPDQVDEMLYEHVRKIAQACEARTK